MKGRQRLQFVDPAHAHENLHGLRVCLHLDLRAGTPMLEHVVPELVGEEQWHVELIE